MSITSSQNRSRLLGIMLSAVVGALSLSASGCKEAHSSELAVAIATTGTSPLNTRFGPLKQINAGVLSVAYAEAGPADGPVVLLLHGWPYDIYSYVDVAPLLAAKGYRVIVPYMRGYGATRFLSSETFRNGEQAAIGYLPKIRERVLNSEDAREGIQSFVERRAAVFRGR